MPAPDIVIRGAREHNLRSVDVVLPRNQLICLTGVSGSGKSSLAFDTLFAEGQRRYVESLSSFARQFLGQMPKPDVDFISGLSPSISISQKSSGQNPRSTVGTITEIYDYLRVLFARVGQGHCPQCSRPITAQSREQIIEQILRLPEKTSFLVLAPVVRAQKGEHRDLFEDLLKQGFVRARVDGTVVQLTDDLKLDRQMRHYIQVVIDRLTSGPSVRPRLAEAVELALRLGGGELIIAVEEGEKAEGGRRKAGKTQESGSSSSDASPSPQPSPVEGEGEDGDALFGNSAVRTRHSEISLSAHYACTHCGLSFEPPSPQLFSFNSPQGMCRDCDGLGEIYSFDPELLVPNPALSFAEGAIELVGLWRDMGRWRRHIFQGVADTAERKREVESGTMLETPWRDLDPELKNVWLYGTGEEHITFTWRNGAQGMKYGGHFEGIIPQLLARYKTSKSKMQQKQLEKYMCVVPCAACKGARLNPQARSVLVTSSDPKFAEKPSRSLPDVCKLAISDASEFFGALVLDETGKKIAEEAIKEIRGRLGFLVNVGLEYLALDRTAPTLSGGESQRIRLAGQIGCGLVGVLYILDEPSIGLHPRDNEKLIGTLEQLRNKGNTVVVVEHDEDTMRAADTLIDFGPGPGVRGGEVIATGPLEKIIAAKRSVTGQFLSGALRIEIPESRRLTPDAKPPVEVKTTTSQGDEKKNGDAKRSGLAAGANRFAGPKRAPAGENWLRIVGASHNNLKNVTAEFPLGSFICVTGVSGSGKSSLVNDILSEALRRDLNGGEGEPGEHERIEGLEHLDKLIAIDQSPIGRTPRSNPATYIKLADDIRDLFTRLPESKARGYKPGRFSFNVEGGRCEACEGNGSNRLEMDFLADVWVTCPVCNGHRFNRETLQLRFKGKNIADVLEMDVQQALEHFENVPDIRRKLQTLHDVGLDYLKLGQASPTLSGGEAQRIKLARELVKKSTGRTLYLLDEPTTGLHFADIQMLLKVLQDLVDVGNTVLVVEHNLDVIKTADWIIDLGPEGGAGGGEIIATGTPETVVGRKAEGGRRKDTTGSSHTAIALAPVLNGTHAAIQNGNAAKSRAARKNAGELFGEQAIKVRGAWQHNLKGVDVEIPRDKMTVCCGLSGSGKSSLAMDTIYAEGQRRYVESLSSYARQFVGQMQKPKLDHIEGLSPAIAIEQKNLGHTPRSTVGTVTEVYDYLRVLLARLGKTYCPQCDVPIGTQSSDEIIEKLMAEPEGTKLYLMAPLEIRVGEKYETLWDEMRASGYQRLRIDGATISLDDPPAIDRRRKHLVEVIVDRVSIKQEARSRIAGSVETCLDLGKGVLHIVYPIDALPEHRWPVEIHSQHFACDKCGRSFEPLTPHSFSFNSPLGWCKECEGLGTQIGANPAVLVRDPKLSLAEGAIAMWPNAGKPQFGAMMAALAAHTGLRIDVPFEQLTARERRIVMHGAGEDWIDVWPVAAKGKKESTLASTAGQASSGTRQSKGNERPLYRFQYKGLYPALEEAARLSPAMRGKLDHLVDDVECSVCGGSRLNELAAAVRLREKTIDEICRLPLGKLLAELNEWQPTGSEKKIAGDLLREIRSRVQFLVDVGLEYLTLGRRAPTLSGGEAQRIRLASQVGSGLCGVLYVLDEPTIGLHPRDNRRLLTAMEKLRDLGNTLLVVEHDREVLAAADQLLDFGPGAGEFGGNIVARGTPTQVCKSRTSITGPYLSGKKAIAVPTNRRTANASVELGVRSAESRKRKLKNSSKTNSALRTPHSELGSNSALKWLEIVGARHNNLRNVNVKIPLAALTAITGVSGSGKSSLIEDVLYKSLSRTLHRTREIPGVHDALRGVELINKVIRVDQQPLGNTPTSNPATYTGVFELIRLLYSQLPDAKVRGYSPRRFSFNAPGGRCEACEGNGQKRIEMHFLPDVWVECEVCRGKRYNPETLAVAYHGQSIADVLEMSCGKALKLFENIPKIRRILQTLCDVGLEYLRLGQPAHTLSGGEAQRVKLAAELARPDTGRTLYLLDEPTTGLHFDDLAKLLEVLHRLVDLGNTVVVIEHNLDVIKTADWLIDMGPEAGEGGGYIVAEGTPEDVIQSSEFGVRSAESKKPRRKENSALRTSHSALGLSHTALALAPILIAGPFEERKIYDFAAAEAKRIGDLNITQVGETAKMPWEADGRKWHTVDRVGRTGEPCEWDGKILERIVDRIHELGEFSPTNWNDRSVVEICAQRKADGWFLHAITGEQWLLKLKFRVAKSTFGRERLIANLGMKPLNEMEELPVYGTDKRVKVKTLRGPWQEIEMRVHSLSEIDHPNFWSFLEEAVAGFKKITERVQQDPESVMPWTVLGRKWHLLRKGFPPGKKIDWPAEMLEELLEMLSSAAPNAQMLWNHSQVINILLPEQREPWARIWTKKPTHIELALTGPKGHFAMGKIAEFGDEPDFDAAHADVDVIKLRFRSDEDLHRGDLAALLREHAGTIKPADESLPLFKRKKLAASG